MDEEETYRKRFEEGGWNFLGRESSLDEGWDIFSGAFPDFKELKKSLREIKEEYKKTHGLEKVGFGRAFDDMGNRIPYYFGIVSVYGKNHRAI